MKSLILILLLISTIQAEKLFDSAWDYTYVLCGYVGMDISYHVYETSKISYPTLKAIGTTILCSVLKEFGDELCKLGVIDNTCEHWFWDRRGFNGIDIVRAGIGALGCTLINSIFDSKVKIRYAGNGIKVNL